MILKRSSLGWGREYSLKDYLKRTMFLLGTQLDQVNCEENQSFYSLELEDSLGRS